MSFPYLKIYVDRLNVSNLDYVDINFASAGFLLAPIITASTDANIDVYVSNITKTSARLNFSSLFSGNVTYIIRPSST